LPETFKIITKTFLYYFLLQSQTCLPIEAFCYKNNQIPRNRIKHLGNFNFEVFSREALLFYQHPSAFGAILHLLELKVRGGEGKQHGPLLLSILSGAGVA
jgi:hypothetical protein